MTQITEVVQQHATSGLIELFELDISPITGTDTAGDHFYFFNDSDATGAAVVWQAKSYIPFPIEADGFDKTTKGSMPRPRLKGSNVTGILTGLMQDREDLVGAKVIRRRTFKEFLDGQPGADPGQHMPDDLYYIERKVSHSKLSVEWELASVLDLEGVMLPSRVITATYCSWQYRGAECGYVGINYFNIKDQVVGSAGLDVCSKAVTGCKARFGATGLLPFGGFPASRVYKV